MRSRIGRTFGMARISLAEVDAVGVSIAPAPGSSFSLKRLAEWFRVRGGK
ncbi:MAG: hypothetical protein ABSH44_17695 [Bryobacteraceae bacterium]